jgi:hypothetical protein
MATEAKKPKPKNYYGVLEIPRDASLDAIKKSYRKLALKWHPDKAPAGKMTDYEDHMKELNAAYGVLYYADQRKEYDKTLPSCDDLKHGSMPRSTPSRPASASGAPAVDPASCPIEPKNLKEALAQLKVSVEALYSTAYHTHLRSYAPSLFFPTVMVVLENPGEAAESIRNIYSDARDSMKDFIKNAITFAFYFDAAYRLQSLQPASAATPDTAFTVVNKFLNSQGKHTFCFKGTNQLVITLEVFEHITVSAVEELIIEEFKKEPGKVGFHPNQPFCLVFGGIGLKRHKTFGEYHVVSESILHIVRLPAPKLPTPSEARLAIAPPSTVAASLSSGSSVTENKTVLSSPSGSTTLSPASSSVAPPKVKYGPQLPVGLEFASLATEIQATLSELTKPIRSKFDEKPIPIASVYWNKHCTPAKRQELLIQVLLLHQSEEKVRASEKEMLAATHPPTVATTALAVISPGSNRNSVFASGGTNTSSTLTTSPAKKNGSCVSAKK